MMAEGWKQIWEDFRNALRGEAHLPIGEQAAKPDIRVEELEAPPSGAADVSLETHTAVPSIQTVTNGAASNIAEETTATVAHHGAMSVAPRAEGHEASGEVPEVLPMAQEPGGDLQGVQPVTTSSRPLPRWRKQLSMAGNVLLIGILVIGVLWSVGGYRIWAQLTAPRPPAPDVVATFDGGQITLADLEAHFKVLTPEQYRTQLRSLENLTFVVHEMVTDELMRRWAATRQPDKDKNFAQTMQHITEDINLNSFYSQLHDNGIPVSESEIQAYYETNKARFGGQPLNLVRDEIRHVLVEQKRDQYLRDYVARLKNNASITRDFALLEVPLPSDAELRTYYEANQKNYVLPARFTVDMVTFPIRDNEAAARAAADKALLQLRSEGDFTGMSAKIPEAQVTTNSTLTEDKLEADWKKAVRVLQPGETSDIFRAGNALYIARLIKLEPARTPSFDEARPRIMEAVQPQQITAWMNNNRAKTLFTIKGKQYNLGQFYSEFQHLSPQSQAQFAGIDGMKKLAEALIDRLVLVEDTYDQLLDVKNKDLIDQTRLDVLKQMFEQEEVHDKLEVNDAEIEQYYFQHQDHMVVPAQARIRYLRLGLGQTPDEEKTARTRVDEAYKKLTSGGNDFPSIAREYSEDTATAANGGELPGWLAETGDPFESPDLHQFRHTALSLSVNQISAPLKVGNSLYIIQVLERTEAQKLSLEQARSHVKDLLTDQQHEERLRELQDRLAQQANVVLYHSVLESYYAQSTSSTAKASQPDNP